MSADASGRKLRDSERIRALGTHFNAGRRQGRYGDNWVRAIVERTPWRDRWAWNAEHDDETAVSEETRVETAGRALLELCAEGKDSSAWFARAATESRPGLFADDALRADGWTRNADGEWWR